MFMMDKVCFLEKKGGNNFLIKDGQGGLSGNVFFEKNSFSRTAAFIFGAMFAAVLNYYIFISMYLSFRIYSLNLLAFIFGLAAFGGSFYLIFSVIRFLRLPYGGYLELGAGRYTLKSVSRNFLRGPVYELEGGDFFARLVFSGIFFRKIIFLNQNKEKVFTVEKKSGKYLFTAQKSVLGLFSRTSSGFKIDLSQDINSSVPPCAAIIAASFYGR